ncbi:MAG: flagellar hook-length control protein FliK [Lachnospiraceae bacterium]|nr:flagellar hook-length control protein FliK [Lachnospiraceae bacterium]
MTTGNISVFSQPMVKSDVQASKAEGKEDVDLTGVDVFSEFMDRSASMQAPDINAEKKETSSQTKSSSPEESYNKLQSETHSNIRQKDSAKDKVDTASPENKKIASDKAEKIKEAIKDEFKVSDEDIEKVMNLLGLTDADLFDQNMLVQLVTELSGAESAVDLLSMPGMSGLLDNVAQIRNELASEFSVAPDELTGVLKLMEEPVDAEVFIVSQDAGVEETDLAAGGFAADAGADMTVSQEAAGDVTQVSDGENQNVRISDQVVTTREVSEKETAEDPALRSSDKVSDTAAEDDNGVPAGDGADNNSFSQDDEGEALGGQTGSFRKKTDTENLGDSAGREAVHNAADTGVHLNSDVHAQAVSSTDDVAGYIDVDNLIEQFATLTRNMENEQTTLSMRLNPENLGQLTLHVTEKQGNLTAEVRVENEQVRDALNTQIAELRANLENAGVKVTAVEVTVETHEFESAYENQTGSAAGGDQRQGDRQGEGAEEAMERITGIRNINLNNPEEIADNLTEAEIVNASVMRDNGNSVDFRA